jgi:hypothetical protein
MTSASTAAVDGSRRRSRRPVGCSTDAGYLFGEQFSDTRVFFGLLNTAHYLRERVRMVAAQRLSRP